LKELRKIVMEDIYSAIVKALEKKEKVALATLITRVGSAPRAVGAKYLIKGDGTSVGSIGGGCVEAEVWQEAQKVMEIREGRVLHFELTSEQLAENGLQSQPGIEHNGANSPESLLFGNKITEIPERVRAASPIIYIKKNAPPFFIQHGTKDAVVPVQQSVGLAAKLRVVLGNRMVKLELIKEAEHADPRFETPENVDKVLDFLDKHLK
jgi:acetyl esterase/lipase